MKEKGDYYNLTKNDTKKLLNVIKGYYNSQFFIDDYVINAWNDTLKEYDLQDAEEHIKEYIKEYPDVAPKPQTFIKGLLTKQQKETIRNSKFTVECNLCHRFMPLSEYDEHYGRCLDIEYLVSVAKEKGEEYGREDLENCKQEVINKLLSKYPPQEWNLEQERTI